MTRPMPVTDEVRERLNEIERVLKFDPRHPDRKQLIREYIEKTENQNGTENYPRV